MTVKCPNCKTADVERAKPFGRFPICNSCKAVAWQKQLRVQRENRACGIWEAHFSKDGTRYGRGISECKYCHKPFFNNRRGSLDLVCPGCLDHHREVLALKKSERAKSWWAKHSEEANYNRLKLKLNKAGLDISWYERQPKHCGICKVTNSGKRGWHIDHDHSCCPSGKFCPRCIRGLLCSCCNTGLGQFKENPEILKQAAKWVEDHPLG